MFAKVLKALGGLILIAAGIGLLGYLFGLDPFVSLAGTPAMGFGFASQIWGSIIGGGLFLWGIEILGGLRKK